MPRDPRFGPMCRQLIDDHGLLHLFQVNTGEPPAGELAKPTPTSEEATEQLSEFFEDLFEKAAELRLANTPVSPPTP